MRIIIVSLIFAIKFITYECALPYSDIVSTSSGDYQGVINKTVDGIPYSSFKGIQYAEKPVKFQAPVPKSRASHVIQCLKEGPNCMQISKTESILGSEDCLFLNVYSPITNLSSEIKDLKAVLFWIHGGTFLRGSGDSCLYGPDGLIGQDIVVVTINYRLGALGWLLTRNEQIPGNAALKDQQLALQWVQKNIKKFGGDPNKVTLAGQSAGSASVSAHGFSDKSKGLFRQQINFSGTIFNNWAYHSQVEAEFIAYSFGTMVNNNKLVISKNELVKVLQEASAETLTIKSYNITQVFPVMKVGMDLFSPNNTVFLNECYVRKYENQNYSIVPTLIGFTGNEVLFFASQLDNLIEEFRKYMSELGQHEFMFLETLSTYIGKKIINLSDLSAESLIDIFSQVFFELGIDLTQRKLCENRNSQTAPIYYYLFDFDGKNYSNHYNLEGITELQGVSHADELSYVWQECPDVLVYPKDPDHPVNIKRRQMTALISNFVKYGYCLFPLHNLSEWKDPTPMGKRDPLLNVKWPNSCNNGDHLLIQEKLSAQYKRPIGDITEILIPFAELKLSLQSDCYASKSIV